MILIVDFGVQYSHLIARKVREANVYCEIIPYTYSIDEIKAKNPKGIILCGGLLKDINNLEVPVFDAQIEPDTETVNNFLYNECGASKDWKLEDYCQDTINRIKAQVGDKKAICALSGGVDSSVAALLVNKAIGSNLICVFVDHGLMRKDEGDEVEKVFKRQFNMNLIRVNAGERFLGKLAGVTDPETKRKIVGNEFIRVFEEEKQRLKDKFGHIDFLVQGTIYPDVIESGTKTAATIKSHHNVGGLPEDMQFKLIEPLRTLFKDEVRLVGIELGIPEELVWRQPFPGPGLGIRVLGEITKEKLHIV
ncbi:MAG: hypothetical protein PHE29_11820, partial [Tissierellia bacterium]|nr:hypothetical protein [Tissierellia bacterium]